MEKLLSHNRPAGFTLIELLVYISVSTVALTVFVTFMVDVSHSAARARTAQELHQNAQFAMDRIGQEVRSSQDVDVSASLFDVDAGRLVLTTGAGAHTFSLVGNTVMFDSGSGAVALSPPSVRVTALRFTNANPGVSIRLHVEEQSLATPAGEREAIDLQTTLVPRQVIYQ